VPYSYSFQRTPLQSLQSYVNFRSLWEEGGNNVGQSKEAVRVMRVGVRWSHSKFQRFATFRKLTVTAILQDTSCKVCVKGGGCHRDSNEGDIRSQGNTIYSLCPWSRVLPEKLSVPQIVKKLPGSYGRLRIITPFTTASQSFIITPFMLRFSVFHFSINFPNKIHYAFIPASGVPRNFFRGRGVSTNLVEDRGEREWGSGGGSPLVRCSGGSCNLVQEISFHMVKFS